MQEKGASLILITNFRYLIFYGYVQDPRWRTGKRNGPEPAVYLYICAEKK